MPHSRKETRWFNITFLFLVFYCGYLLIFRSLLINIEGSSGYQIFKPEPVQVIVVALLVLMYHFCFLGLISFSQTGQWQKLASGIIGLLITGSILYGLNEWYGAIVNPFFRLPSTVELPWYAVEKTKFFLVNLPLLVYLVLVFVLRILLMFSKAHEK